ncbi:MAG: hypothetical protein GKR89_05520 [Candidatus Latescibacteria bacterium]|nr:hypothetical protein [Candidatus Latescibacterota bacterium]
MKPQLLSRTKLGAILLIFLAACQNDPEPPVPQAQPQDDLVLAQVGQRPITLAVYRQHLEKIPPQLQGQLDSERYLQAIIDEELLFQEARRRGLDQSIPVQQALQQEARSLALGQLYKHHNISSDDPTEEELRTYFERSPYNRQVRFSLLMVRERGKIPPLVQQLKDGADFEELSMQHSQDVRILQRNADMGYHRWGETMPSHKALTEQAFSMRPGQMAGPMQVADGYFLIKVTDVHPISFDEERETIARLVTQNRLADQLDSLYTQLHRHYNVQLTPEALPQLAAHLSKPGQTSVATAPLVTYDGGSLTLIQCSQLMQNGGQAANSDPEKLHSTLVRQIGKQVLVPLEIERLKLTAQGVLQESLNRTLRERVVRQLRQQVTAQTTAPNDNVFKLFFEDNKQRYAQPELVEVRRLPVSDPEEGQRILQRLHSGQDTTALVQGFVNITYGTAAMAGDNPVSRALQAPVGTFHGPFSTERGYVVLHIFARHAAHTPALDEIRDQVVEDFYQTQKNQLFQAFLEELRTSQAEQIQLYDQNLHQLALIAPAETTTP